MSISAVESQDRVQPPVFLNSGSTSDFLSIAFARDRRSAEITI